MFAATGAGAALANPAAIASSVEPDVALAAVFASARERYEALYPVLLLSGADGARRYRGAKLWAVPWAGGTVRPVMFSATGAGAALASPAAIVSSVEPDGALAPQRSRG